MFKFKPNIFNHEIGIDIGTVNTVIYVKSKGVTIDEPSVIAVRNLNRKGQKEIIAFGAAAKKMIGRTPVGISTLRPLSHGVIADFEMTRHMIRHYMARAGASGGVFSHPRVAVCVPASIGLPINEAQGNMVVNMGGGTCEVAVMSLGGIVINQSLRVAGEAIDEAIVSLLRQNYTLAIGESTAEEIKIAIGSVIPLEQELRMDVKGRDLVDGLPKVVTISSEEVRDAIEPIIVQIEDTIRTTLERTPPELVRDIVDQGIVLSGGTANLRGLNIRFADALNVPIHIAEQPLYSVALGLGKILETPRKPSEVSITLDNKPGA